MTRGRGNGARSVGALFVRDTSLLLAVRLYGAAVNFGVFVWLARVASPGTTGRWASLLAVWSVLGVLIDFGGEQQATRAMAQAPGRTRAVLGTLLRMKGSLAVAGLGLLAIVAFAIEPPDGGRAAYAISALTVIGLVAGALAVVLRVRHRVGRLALAVATGQTVFLLLAANTLASPATDVVRFQRLALGYALGAIVGGGLLFVFGWRALAAARETRGGGAADRPVEQRPDEAGDTAGDPAAGGGRAFLAAAWPQGVAALAAILYFQLDTLMVKAIAGDAAAGFYSAAYRLLGLFVAVSGTAAAALLPIASRAAGRPARFRAVFSGSLALLVLAGVLLSTLVLAVADDLFRWLYAARMSDYRVSLPTLRILFIAGVFAAAGAAGSIRLIALGRARGWMWIVIGGVALNVLANLWAIPRFGHVGAAWTTLGTEAAVAIAALSDAVRGGVAADGRPIRWREVFSWAGRLVIVTGASFTVAWVLRDGWLLGAAAGAVLFSLGAVATRLIPRRLFALRSTGGI